MIWSTLALSKALNINIQSEIHCGPVQFNSNDVAPGDLFIALQGNNDGHDYVSHALERGAAAAIVSRKVEGVDRDKTIQVTDTLAADNLPYFRGSPDDPD